ncbi:Helicase-like transcription factor isoform X1 [Mycena venus]|uniref:Helicase-like transcription factor isoform X1 n=1 Tax=Mycena venus TaxID=2733690 RepID=A0A8H7CEB7_9AGAR|nr:Helicase-like transcription factor isoform X1 [Mycena venus]
MAQLASSSDEWLRSAILTARALTAAADSFPLPYGKAAFDAVVLLLETVESAKKNRHDLRALCQGSMKIMDILHDQMTINRGTISANLCELCEEFESLLQRILDTVLDLQSQSRIGAMFSSRKIKERIVAYRREIKELRSNCIFVASCDTNARVNEIHHYLTHDAWEGDKHDHEDSFWEDEEDEHDAGESEGYYSYENEYRDEESVWEEDDEHDYGNETEQNEYRYEEDFQREDEEDAWEDEQDYRWHNEEGGGWREDMEVNGYNEDNLQAASEPDPPNLRCTICLDTVCRPVVTLCLHIFCDECIYNVLSHGSLACPLCRATITEPPEPDTILDRYLEQVIADGTVTGPSGGRSSPYTWRDVNFSQH